MLLEIWFLLTVLLRQTNVCREVNCEQGKRNRIQPEKNVNRAGSNSLPSDCILSDTWRATLFWIDFLSHEQKKIGKVFYPPGNWFSTDNRLLTADHFFFRYFLSKERKWRKRDEQRLSLLLREPIKRRPRKRRNVQNDWDFGPFFFSRSSLSRACS